MIDYLNRFCAETAKCYYTGFNFVAIKLILMNEYNCFTIGFSNNPQTEISTVIEGDREVSLRSSSQQPPVILCQMRSAPAVNRTHHVGPGRGTARP